ncbi:hypothetical protein LZ190_20535 [Rhodovulum sulfidophilum]|nr:hypothetical protein [Rhodovulum sulfidophilum]
MFVNRSLTQRTLSLFQSPSPRPTGEASPSGDLSGGFGSSQGAEMSGVYNDPSRNGASKGSLSQQTLEELEAVRPLIANELAALRTAVDEMFAADLDRNLASAIRHGALTEGE